MAESAAMTKYVGSKSNFERSKADKERKGAREGSKADNKRDVKQAKAGKSARSR